MTFPFNDSRMGDATAWAPIQEPAELFDGCKGSPCRWCRHVFEDKNVCRTFADCPIRIETVYPGSIDRPGKSMRKGTVIGKIGGSGKCQWPGCNNPVKKGRYCVEAGHSKAVSNRKRRYPNNPERWFEPIWREKRQ